MGALLQYEQCDLRLALIERDAYEDMHGRLAPAVHRSMKVAAAEKLRVAQAEMRRQQNVISDQAQRIQHLERTKRAMVSRVLHLWRIGHVRAQGTGTGELLEG